MKKQRDPKWWILLRKKVDVITFRFVTNSDQDFNNWRYQVFTDLRWMFYKTTKKRREKITCPKKRKYDRSIINLYFKKYHVIV